MLRLSTWLAIGGSLLLGASYLAPHTDPYTGWLIAFCGLFYPWILLFNVLVILFYGWRKKWIVLLPLLTILSGVSSLKQHFNWSCGSAIADSENIGLLTYNLHGLRVGNTGEYIVSPEQFANWLQQQDAQVVAFQEFPAGRQKGDEYIRAILARTTLRHVYWEAGHSLAVFSSFPLRKKSSTYFGNASNGIQEVVLDIDTQEVLLLNIHLQSNAVSTLADEMVAEGDIREKSTRKKLRTMLGRYRRAAQKRKTQAQKIAPIIQASKKPVLVAGDFNDVPLSHAYHVIKGDLQDAFAEKGCGLGFTYSGSVPGLRIDYWLIDHRFPILERSELNATYSDHDPVLVRVAKP